MNDADKYAREFDVNNEGSRKLERALTEALDIRKFEIDLYWKRGTYFWTLIAATFAGYIAILSTEKLLVKEFYAFVIAWIGVVFSFAWVLVNLGSKFWQENWECHVDMLEDAVCGPLYKTVLANKDARGALPISVTRVNLWASAFTVAVWLVMLTVVFPWGSIPSGFEWKYAVISGVGAAAICILIANTGSSRAKTRTFVRDRRIVVVDPKETTE